MKYQKKTYESIKSAHGILQQYNEDLYNAWKIGKYHKQDILDNGIEYIQANLSLSRADIVNGMAYVVITSFEEDWFELSEDEKNDYIQKIEETDKDFLAMLKNDLEYLCLSIVIGTYTINGATEECQSYLDTAKEQMKELSQSYSDYAHYSSLVDFFNQKLFMISAKH